ncbi:hypothetical protein [Massilia varians]|uniref:hypothetical protein n=1 Tax=Massilia varians TaxID=457921 RepID=UPI002552353A|nr:hypothetical protein [Massilia varians]MDK6079680.1 hypothetical protein [Massilia varians]
MAKDFEKKMQQITMAELIEFFTAVGISPNCPTCNHGRSAINVAGAAADNNNPVRFWVTEAAEPDQKGGMSTVAMLYPMVLTACENCGFIRHFSALHVHDWLNNKHPERERGNE